MITKEQLDTFQAQYDKITSEAYFIAKQLQAKIKKAHEDFYGIEAKYDNDNYWAYKSDRIEIEVDSDGISANFWEYGRCGGDDEIIHTIKFTPELFTEEGQAAYVEAWKIKQADKNKAAAEAKEREKQQKIYALEMQLIQLKGESK